MKKTLLSMFAALAMALPSMAQWSTDFAENNQINPDSTENYGYELQTNNNGITYVFMQIPYQGTISMRLQILDKDGVKLFPDTAKVLSAEPNISFTKVNKHLMIDNDGNAIIAVSDFRSGNEGYTIYKVNEKGDVLWSKSLKGVDASSNVAGMTMACSEDGGYVFAYEPYDLTTNFGRVQLEKLKADGTDAWDDILRFSDKSNSLSFPYVVDAGSSQTLLVYAKGSNNDLIANLIDFDGSTVWDEDVPVYRGGFTSIPVWVQMGVSEAPDNGMFVYWRDAQDDSYENRISYIMNDGTYGFSTGEEGTIISHDTDNSRDVPSIYYDKDDKAIYFVYRVFNQASQGYQGIYMQKMSLDGELLWGANGKAIVEVQNTDSYSYSSVQDAGDGKIAIFYMRNEGGVENGNVDTYMVLFDKDGNKIQNEVNVSLKKNTKYSVNSSRLIDGEYYLLDWEEHVKVSLNNIVMQRVFLNGTATGIKNVTDGANGKNIVRTEYFSLGGERLQAGAKGVSIKRNVYADGTVKTQKVIAR